MKKILLILSLLFMCGCDNWKNQVSSSNPRLLIEGTVKEVKYTGTSGIFTGVTTIIHFTDGRTKVLKGAFEFCILI